MKKFILCLSGLVLLAGCATTKNAEHPLHQRQPAQAGPDTVIEKDPVVAGKIGTSTVMASNLKLDLSSCDTQSMLINENVSIQGQSSPVSSATCVFVFSNIYIFDQIDKHGKDWLFTLGPKGFSINVQINQAKLTDDMIRQKINVALNEVANQSGNSIVKGGANTIVLQNAHWIDYRK